MRSHLLKIVFISMLIGAPSLQAYPQDNSPSGVNCGEPTESGPNTTNGWAANTSVTVNINTSGMTQAQINDIQTAFTNWNGVGGVTFNISTSQSSISAGTSTYNVSMGTIPSGDPASSTPGDNSDGTVDNNDTVLNSSFTCDACLMATMAHEIGHTFGLNDNHISNSVMDDSCNGGDINNFVYDCGSPGPTNNDMAASDCENSYSHNDCDNPGTYSAQCSCGSGTSGDCSGGLTCQSGICGCSDACDDPSCPGWTQSCGTCRSDGDCSGGLTCSGGSCGCSDSCDDPSCPGYDSTACAQGEPCPTGGCPGGLSCVGGTCGCEDQCDDPSCDPNYDQDCGGGYGNGGSNGNGNGDNNNHNDNDNNCDDPCDCY